MNPMKHSVAGGAFSHTTWTRVARRLVGACLFLWAEGRQRSVAWNKNFLLEKVSYRRGAGRKGKMYFLNDTEQESRGEMQWKQKEGGVVELVEPSD